jgi:pimeloyl-ACP methyl ester carboxylesterase
MVSRFANRKIQANGIDIAYAESGKGPLVLLLHGFPDTDKTWDRTLPVLAEAGFHAVAPSLPAYPPSSFAPDGEYRPLRLGEDVLALIGAFGKETANIL